MYESLASGAQLGDIRVPFVPASFDTTLPSRGGSSGQPPALPASAGGLPDSVPRRLSVLLIDDDAGMREVGARVLTEAGFTVDVAECGSAGLARAVSLFFDAIVVDLKLPDMSGLSVLKELQDKGVTAPVLMLTGFATWESGVAAMKLGAADFRSKPLFDQELVQAVHALLDRDVSSSSVRRNWSRSGAGGELGIAFHDAPDAVGELLRALEACSRSHHAKADSPGHSGDASRRQARQLLVWLFVRVLATPDLSIRTFAACAAGLRATLATARGRRFADAMARVTATLAKPRTAPDVLGDKRLSVVLAGLEAAAHEGRRLSEAELAKQLGISAAHVGRLLHQHTGFGYREWGRAHRIMRAVQALIEENGEQIAQLAYGLRYNHPSQLDRQFREMLGLTPTQFRRALGAAAQAHLTDSRGRHSRE